MFTMDAPLTAQRRNAVPGRKKEAVAVGFKVGGELVRYAYPQNPELNTLSFDSMIHRLRRQVGVLVELPVANGVYVSPQVVLAGRGDSRLFVSEGWHDTVQYQAKVNYLELRVPVSVEVPMRLPVTPYFFVAPSFGLTLPKGEIRQRVGSVISAVGIDSCNMAVYDIGLLAGVGGKLTLDFSSFRLHVKMEAGYYLGGRDTYSPMEHLDQSQATNVSAYNINGTRKNRGWELAVTLSLPLKFYRDACGFGQGLVPGGSRGCHNGF